MLRSLRLNHTRRVASHLSKGLRRGRSVWKSTHSAQNNSELDFGGLQRSDSSTSDGQRTQRNIRQDDQFHCELKHKETQQG